MIVRANPDGSVIRVSDVGGSSSAPINYPVGRLNGKPAAMVAVFQSPGSNALEVDPPGHSLWS